MLSFCDFLRNFEKYQNGSNTSACKELIRMPQKVSFTVLDSIDATLILKPNDLIGAILGKMLVAIKEKEKRDTQIGNPKNIEIRKLKSQLGAIYSSLMPSDVEKEDVAPGEVLEQLSRSWNQQQAFREAVKKFNEYMIEFRGSISKNYLVVPIDDVDMNLRQGYQLLEAIRKYLMAPNVIVLLAADYLQIGQLCIKEYNEVLQNTNVQTEELALEYLEKLIPTGRRIYMPELYPEINLYGKRIIIRKENGAELPIKELILCQVWEHVGIILNKDVGTKHWLQPHSLRKLSNYINSLHALVDFGTDDDKNIIFNKNIIWFFDDLMSRYLNEKDVENREHKKIISIIEMFNNEVPQNKIPKLVGLLATEEFSLPSEYVTDKSTYGILLTYLYQQWKVEEQQTKIQAISFAVSLYMRTYIYAIENAEDAGKREEHKDKFLEITKGMFWGDIEQIIVNGAGQATQLSLDTLLDVEQLKGLSDISAYGLLIFAMQLGLSWRKKAGEVKGNLRFGNFVNTVFDYQKKIQDMADILKEQECFKGKKEEIQQECTRMITEFEAWEIQYNTTRVIPFDSIEFMFDLYTKLYGSQGTFGWLSSLNENSPYCDAYEHAVSEVGEMLKQYDMYYNSVRKKYKDKENRNLFLELKQSYYEVYVECPFIKYMTSEENAEERKKIFSACLEFILKGNENKSQKGNEDRD